MRTTESVRLSGVERFFYFSAPQLAGAMAALWAWGVCVSIYRFSQGDHTHSNNVIMAMTIAGTALFSVAAYISYYILKRQQRFKLICTNVGVNANYKLVMTAARSAGWSVQSSFNNGCVRFSTSSSIFKCQSRVTVIFRDHQVLVNSIVDPMGVFTGGIRSQSGNIAVVTRAVA